MPYTSLTMVWKLSYDWYMMVPYCVRRSNCDSAYSLTTIHFLAVVHLDGRWVRRWVTRRGWQLCIWVSNVVQGLMVNQVTIWGRGQDCVGSPVERMKLSLWNVIRQGRSLLFIVEPCAIKCMWDRQPSALHQPQHLLVDTVQWQWRFTSWDIDSRCGGLYGRNGTRFDLLIDPCQKGIPMSSMVELWGTNQPIEPSIARTPTFKQVQPQSVHPLW